MIKALFKQFYMIVFLIGSILIHPTSNPAATPFNKAAKISIVPNQALAGSFQKLELKFHPGKAAIKNGGGIRFELPVAYLETGPYYWDAPQNINEEARGFVHAETTRGNKLSTKIYGHRNRIVECNVDDVRLTPGDSIHVYYSGIVQSLSGKCIVRVQWRESSDDEWENVKPYPEINIIPHDAVTILLITPTEAAQNEPFKMSVTLLDKFGNLATGYTGRVEFSSTDSLATIPMAYTFTQADSGTHTFSNVKFASTGFQKIEATDGKLNGKFNYTYVSNSPAKYKRHFGDTHFHTGTGMDNKGFTEIGRGGDHRGHFTTEFDAYKYARDVMHLDFASAAEHDAKDIDKEMCSKIQDIGDLFYEPGKFTTFFAYEWTAAPKIGHHVVLFKDRVENIFNHFDYPTKPDLLNILDQQNIPAIVIPHPMWAQTDHEIWEHVNDKYGKIGEIYSLWCSRFLLQPNDETQRFELGPDDAWSFQYAWKRGHKIGVIGSTDNHTGRPGANNFTTNMVHSGGLAVVLAEENNREKIWDAFEDRRTYATTGTRIYLDFTCNGHFMGVEFDADKQLTFSVKAAGTNKLESVELVKYDKANGYHVIKIVHPDSEFVQFDFIDSNFTENSMYYVRVKQVDEIWRGAWSYPYAEAAWSSPIWVNYSQ